MSSAVGTGKYERLLERCKGLAPVPTAVAYPCEESALAGAVEAGQAKLIVPLLVGPEAEIKKVAAASNIDISNLQIVDAPNAITPGTISGGWLISLTRSSVTRGSPNYICATSTHFKRCSGARGQRAHRVSHGQTL